MSPQGTFSLQFPTLLSGDELGWRLAGITDGEGCFAIRRSGRSRGSFSCVFTIGVRDDDRDLLELLRDSTGLGRIYTKRVTEIERARRPGVNPQAHWCVARISECRVLADLFQEYPLVSRKQHDCEIWAEAVAAWERQDWSLMRALWDDLTKARTYRSAAA